MYLFALASNQAKIAFCLLCFHRGQEMYGRIHCKWSAVQLQSHWSVCFHCRGQKGGKIDRTSVKKKSLFTQPGALFEGLDDNPKRSAFWTTEHWGTFFHSILLLVNLESGLKPNVKLYVKALKKKTFCLNIIVWLKIWRFYRVTFWPFERLMHHQIL